MLIFCAYIPFFVQHCKLETFPQFNIWQEYPEYSIKILTECACEFPKVFSKAEVKFDLPFCLHCDQWCDQ